MTLTNVRQSYDFHGLTLAVEAEPAVLTALDARLGLFPPGTGSPCELLFNYGARERFEDLPDGARKVYESPMGRALYSEEQDRMYIRSLWPIAAEVRPRDGRALIDVSGAHGDYIWELAHPMFTLPLIELLKRRQYFNVHAAGLTWGGRGMLLPGTSGSGKSTLALALARQGFGFQSDDMVFLARRAEQLTTLAFPEAFDLTESSIQLFPELSDVLRTPKPAGAPKHQLPLDAQISARVSWQAHPRLLVFPRVRGEARSVISPLSRSEALLELVPNILLTDPVASQLQFDALGELIASCECYRLETGTDFAELALRLRDLLEGAP